MEMDLGNIAAASWPAAVVAVVAFAWWLISSKAKAAALERARRKARRAAYGKAEAEWKAATESGDATAICEAKAKVDAMRRAGWHLLAIAAICAAVCGCRTRTETKFIPVGEHIQFLNPGDTVPELPQGETRWILLSSPTGARMALPSDSPIVDAEGE